jgi:hypothetical protein
VAEKPITADELLQAVMAQQTEQGAGSRNDAAWVALCSALTHYCGPGWESVTPDDLQKARAVLQEAIAGVDAALKLPPTMTMAEFTKERLGNVRILRRPDDDE